VLKSVYFYRKNAGNMKKICILNGALYYIYTNIIGSSFTHGQKKHHASTCTHPTSTHGRKTSRSGGDISSEVLSSLKGNIFLNFKREPEK